MNILRKTPVAWSITIVLILVAILGLGGSKLSNQAEQAAQFFYQGINNDGLSINHDLSRRADTAYNLYTVASRYLDATDSQLTALLQARNQLTAAESIADKYTANNLLDQSALAVYDKLAEYQLSEADQGYRQNLITELASANATISHDGYNAKATDFNNLRNGFPAALISKLCGIDELEYFR